MSNQKQPWYQIRNAAKTDDGPAEILIYDVIDSWMGVSAEQLVRDLAGITTSEITVRINSPGGSVFDGIAILNALRGHDAKVTTVVDGLAASIASVIAMAGDEIVMNRNSTMMVHNAWDICVGNADEMQKAADFLRQVSGNIASIYADKAGGTVDDWKATMQAETWYTADEAVAAGLADSVLSESADKNSAAASTARASAFDLSKFKYPGRAAAPAPRIQKAHNDTPLPIVEAEVNNGKEPPVATLNESIVEVLGLDAEADDDAILAKVGELAARPEKVDDAPPAPPAEPSIEEATKVAAKFGMTVVNKAWVDETTATIADLSSARASQLAADDARTIQNALDTGRIDPASKDVWSAELAKNRDGITALLATMPANQAVPVGEIGHGISREDQPDDTEKANVFAMVTGQTFGKEA